MRQSFHIPVQATLFCLGHIGWVVENGVVGDIKTNAILDLLHQDFGAHTPLKEEPGGFLVLGELAHRHRLGVEPLGCVVSWTGQYCHLDLVGHPADVRIPPEAWEAGHLEIENRLAAIFAEYGGLCIPSQAGLIWRAIVLAKGYEIRYGLLHLGSVYGDVEVFIEDTRPVGPSPPG